MASLDRFLRDLVPEPAPSMPYRAGAAAEPVTAVIRTVTLRCPHGFCGRAWRVPMPALRLAAWACPGCRRALQPAEVEVIAHE